MFSPRTKEFFRVGDRVLLIDTSHSGFDFHGIGLVAGRATGVVEQLPEEKHLGASVLVLFDWIDGSICVSRHRLQLENPLERLGREI
jgi:hypothetical protein